MRIYNTINMHHQVQRHTSYVQLYKILNTYTENKEIDGIIETVITGRDWEFISLPMTSDMDILNGVDPLVENFETYFANGLLKERKDISVKKIMDARECRWRTVEVKVFDNGIFSNLAAERNSTLLFRSVGRYNKGKPVRWMNLDTEYIAVDETNINSFEELEEEISAYTQFTFDVLSMVMEEIRELKTNDEIMDYDSVKRWKELFEVNKTSVEW